MGANTVEIYGTEYEVKVGSVVLIDGRHVSERLMASDWDRAAFRYPINNGGPYTSWAVNVEITGRSVQYRNGVACVKVRVEFLDEDEPSRFVAGWLYLD